MSRQLKSVNAPIPLMLKFLSMSFSAISNSKKDMVIWSKKPPLGLIIIKSSSWRKVFNATITTTATLHSWGGTSQHISDINQIYGY